MFSQLDLDVIVRKAITLYNRFRSPEATAKLVNVTPENVTIAFSGTFCYSCGVLDYLEDFVHEFKMFTDKFELKIGNTRQTSSNSFEADFKVKHR